MSSFSPGQFVAGTMAAAASDVFGSQPQQGAPQSQPQAPPQPTGFGQPQPYSGAAPSGGGVQPSGGAATPPGGSPQYPGVTPQPFSPQVPQAPPQAPAQPPAPQVPPQVPPQYQQQAPPASPPASSPQQVPAAGRYQIDRLVSQGLLPPAEALRIRDDNHLFDLLLATNQYPDPAEPPAQPRTQTPVQSPPTQQTPAAQTPAQPAQPTSTLSSFAQPLIASGAIVDQGGFYVASTPELSAVAASLNQEVMKSRQELAAKQAIESLNPVIEELKGQITTLRDQLVSSVPKPHEAWLDQHRDYLYVKDAAGKPTHALNPAGALYDQVWRDLSQKGVQDENILHNAASVAVTNYWRSLPPMPSAPAAPQQTFMQAAASSTLQPNPGFNLPGSYITPGPGSQQEPLFVTNQGHADWDAIANGLANGTIT